MTATVRMSRSRPPSPVPQTQAITTPGVVVRQIATPMAGSLTTEPAQPLGTLYAYTPEQPLPPPPRWHFSDGGIAGMSLYRDTLDGFMRNMQAQVAELREAILEEREARNPRKWSIHSEREARKVVDQKLVTLSAELKACKKRFVNYQALPDMDLRKALDRIESRGHIHIDIGRDPGQVYLLHPITFVRRTAGDAPTAAFTHPDLAHAICEDLAEAARLFDCTVAVEGHTKGGEGEFWQVLANNRARLVAEKINSLGVDSDKITCQGLPGRLGLNDSCTVVRLGIQGFAKQLVPNYPFLESRVASLSNGHVVVPSDGGFVESWVSSPSVSRAPSPSVSRMVSSRELPTAYLESQPIGSATVLGSSMSVPYIESRAITPTASMRSGSTVALPRATAVEVSPRTVNPRTSSFTRMHPLPVR